MYIYMGSCTHTWLEVLCFHQYQFSFLGLLSRAAQPHLYSSFVYMRSFYTIALQILFIITEKQYLLLPWGRRLNGMGCAWKCLENSSFCAATELCKSFMIRFSLPISGLMQDYGNFITDTLDLTQSCTKANISLRPDHVCMAHCWTGA